MQGNRGGDGQRQSITRSCKDTVQEGRGGQGHARKQKGRTAAKQKKILQGHWPGGQGGKDMQGNRTGWHGIGLSPSEKVAPPSRVRPLWAVTVWSACCCVCCRPNGSVSSPAAHREGVSRGDRRATRSASSRIKVPPPARTHQAHYRELVHGHGVDRHSTGTLFLMSLRFPFLLDQIGPPCMRLLPVLPPGLLGLQDPQLLGWAGAGGGAHKSLQGPHRRKPGLAARGPTVFSTSLESASATDCSHASAKCGHTHVCQSRITTL